MYCAILQSVPSGLYMYIHVTKVAGHSHVLIMQVGPWLQDNHYNIIGNSDVTSCVLSAAIY